MNKVRPTNPTIEKRVGVLAIIIATCLLQGCCPVAKSASASWHTSIPAQSSVIPHSEARVISSLFGGLELRGTSNTVSRLNLDGIFYVTPIDPEAHEARIDVRGAVSLSRKASAVCHFEWNGKVLHFAQLPCDAPMVATNQEWFVRALVPIADIRPRGCNRLTLELSLTAGTEPSMDYLALDSIEVHWQTNQPPAQP